LGEYMSAHVLNADRMMICRHYEACSGSVRPHDVFDPGQLSFVGKNYDLTVDGAPVRIVVVGQEPGLWSPDGDRARGHGVTLEDRYKLIHDGSGLGARYYADGSHPGRNPHMRGTTSALRILLCVGLGTDHETEFIKTLDGTSFHLFDAFALVNVLLCAAGPSDSSRGRSTTTMQRNCLDHFAETVRILEPTILVLQGRGVQRWIAPKIKQLWTIADHVFAATIAGVDTVICSFTHPSAHSPLGWGSRLDGEYLVHTVQPALVAAITAQRATSDPESMHENGGHQNEPESCR